MALINNEMMFFLMNFLTIQKLKNNFSFHKNIINIYIYIYIYICEKITQFVS